MYVQKIYVCTLELKKKKKNNSKKNLNFTIKTNQTCKHVRDVFRKTARNVHAPCACVCA